MNSALLRPLDSLLHENWALVALVIFLAALIFRFILLRDCFHAAKGLGKETYKQIMHQYASQSLAGWMLVLASVVLAEALLAFPKWLPLWTSRRNGGFVAILAFVLGSMLHLRAVHLATVRVLKERSELDRNF